MKAKFEELEANSKIKNIRDLLQTQRKLLGTINVDFDETGQLLIINSPFVKCLRKHGKTMKK
jgi:hypothetical protein